MSAFVAELTASLLGDAEVQALVRDEARIAAMLRFEAALARAEAAAGVVPAGAADAIAALTKVIDLPPAALAAGTARDGVPVPALVKRLREALPAQHRGWLHHGATSQDVVDTAMVLTTLDAVDLLRHRLVVLVDRLVALARRHARDLVAGRTRHQLATPTTFGLKVAGWAAPVARHLDRLDQARPRFALVSLAGSSGSLAALGPAGPAVEARLAAELGLAVPDGPWHTARDGVAELGSVLALVAGSLGRIGADVLTLAQNEVGEARPGSAGGSSTMPHKANPIAAEMLVTLAGIAADRAAALSRAVLASGERDGVAWTAEWVALPDLLVAVGASTRIAGELVRDLVVDTAAMAARATAAPGLLHAEIAVFALAAVMPRAEAEDAVAAASRTALAEGRHLVEVLEEITGAAVDWARLTRLDQVVEAAALRVDRAVAALAARGQPSPEAKVPDR